MPLFHARKHRRLTPLGSELARNPHPPWAVPFTPMLTTPRRSLATLALAASLFVLGGCQVGQLIGGMAGSAERQGKTEFKPKYTKLQDKSFAVIVAADRSIQSEFPDIVTITTFEMTKRLAENAGSSGVLPAAEVLRYQSQHPGWVAKPLGELAKTLGVDRVVYVDLQDFRMTDPGNPYVYTGVASGVVHVAEVESEVASEFAFGKDVRVKYPDMTGMSSAQIPRAEVFSELARRFIERSAWMFYSHEEPNAIKY